MKLKPSTRLVLFLTLALSLLATLTVGCEGKTEVETVVEKKTVTIERTVVARETIVQERYAAEPTNPPLPTLESQPTEAPSTSDGQSVGHAPSASVDYQASQRMIIKDASLDLEVENVDRAIDGTTQVAGDLRGYIISHRVWYQQEHKYATITLAVPVQEFENALRRLRGLAVSVLNESASGEDVTDQYVDLQSRLRNLGATRDRIRSFLDQAQDVDEALAVNRELSDIEGQIEQVQGRLNYLRDRAAFSTITVSLSPVDTAPEPEAGDVWRPGQTARRALDELFGLLQSLADVLIWLVIVVGPLALLVGLVLWPLVRWLRRWRAARQMDRPPAAE